MRNSRITVSIPIAFFVLIAGSLAALPASAGGVAGVQPAATPTPTTEPAKDVKPVEEKLAYVMLETSMGSIGLELNNEKAPISTANFLSYVKKGHYSGTIFHRVMDGFMIQGGGFDASLKQKATDRPIKNEWQNGLKNKKYTLAMARTSVPDSGTCQFYINVVDNDMLDEPRDGAAYAVFGKVVSGFEVVDAIKGVKTGNKGGMRNVPLETITITGAKVVTKEEAEGASPGASKPSGTSPATDATEKKAEPEAPSQVKDPAPKPK